MVKSSETTVRVDRKTLDKIVRCGQLWQELHRKSHPNSPPLGLTHDIIIDEALGELANVLNAAIKRGEH